MIASLKRILPDRPIPLRVWRGPFRGAHIVANPRASLRKVFGLYEHELNPWLEQVLPNVRRLLDVGANDGYFTFGCAAAFDRLGIAADIVCFEPQPVHVSDLRRAIAGRGQSRVCIQLVDALVGAHVGSGLTTLDALAVDERRHTLIKIDVEGAEVDVLRGAGSWIDRANAFVIEVHRRPYLDVIQRMFADHGVALVQVNQRPLPLLGRGMRDLDNWWLVSDLGRSPTT